MSLMNLTQMAIWRYTTRDNGNNLLAISKILPLPSLLQNYIVFNMSPTETKEAFLDQIEEPEIFDYDSDDSDLEDCIDY